MPRHGILMDSRLRGNDELRFVAVESDNLGFNNRTKLIGKVKKDGAGDGLRTRDPQLGRLML
jgi:hypothetical protein